MKINWTNILLFAICLVVGTLLFAGLQIAVTSSNPATTYGKAEVAYWAQAILAFATIFVAIYVLRAQGDHAANLMIRADERTLRRRVDSIGAILDEACYQIEQVAEAIHGTAARKAKAQSGVPEQPQDADAYVLAAVSRFKGKPQFDNIIRAIDTIPLYEVGGQQMVRAIFDIRSALFNFDAHIVSTWTQNDGKVLDGALWNAAAWWPEVVSAAKREFERAATTLFSA